MITRIYFNVDVGINTVNRVWENSPDFKDSDDPCEPKPADRAEEYVLKRVREIVQAGGFWARHFVIGGGQDIKLRHDRMWVPYHSVKNITSEAI